VNVFPGRHTSIVFAISKDLALDQKELALVKGLKQIVGRGNGHRPLLHSRTPSLRRDRGRTFHPCTSRCARKKRIRFVIGRKDDESHVEQGIFQAAAQALEWQSITGSDADELAELRGWFSENLEKPTSFGRFMAQDSQTTEELGVQRDDDR